MKKIYIIFILFSLLFSEILVVPGQYSTIQAAINASSDGDEVYVLEGTYYEAINFNGKNISVVGESRESTIIAYNESLYNNDLVTVVDGENINSTALKNFTLTGQVSDPQGRSAIYIGHNSGITLDNLHIADNYSPGQGPGLFMNYNGSVNILNSTISNNSSGNSRGGGVYIEDSEAYIYNSEISNNTALSNGGGICILGSSITTIDETIINGNITNVSGGGIYTEGGVHLYLSKTLLHDNYAGYSTPNGGGGAIFINAGSTAEISGITVVENSSPTGSIIGIDGANVLIENSIIRNNESPNQIHQIASSNLMLSFSNIQGGWDGEGNIDADSEFNDDYTLQSTSPCIDAGDPNSELDPDGTRADMGAYPFYQIPGCTDSYACNYDEAANMNDSSCEYSCHDNGDYSLSFDGINDWVDLSNHMNDLNYPFTLSTQVLITNDNNIIYFFDSDFHTGNPIYSGIWFIYDGNNIEISLGDGVGCCAPSHRRSKVSEFNLEPYRWYDIDAVVVNPTNMIIYVDGEDIGGEYSGDGNIPEVVDLGSNATIGNYVEHDNSETTYSSQIINEFLVWNRALSDEEVNNGPNNEDGLVAYYKSGDLSNTLYDYSGNGNHGTIYGAQWSACTDPLADNYNEGADIDDGSCVDSPVNSEDFTYFGSLNGHYYYLSHEGITWIEGKSLAEVNNGHLVAITSEVENNFLYNNLNSYLENLSTSETTAHVKIGLFQNFESNNFSEPGGGWEWVTGENLDYQNWNPGEPNNATDLEHYGILRPDGLWNDGVNITSELLVLELEAGCTDVLACNYQPYFYEDNGSCEYPEENYDCDGNCIVNIDCADECGGSATIDCAGECGGSTVEDCAGDCGGSAFLEGESCVYEFSIDLHEGANLISFYILPEDDSVGNVLSPLGDNAIGIIGEGSAATNLPPWVGSLTEIECDKGYWLTVSEATEFNTTGFQCGGENQLYNIQEGVNLISYPYGVSNTISAAIPDSFEGYILAIIGEGTAAIQTAPGVWVGSLTELEPGKGYWFKSSANFMFAFDPPE